MTDPSVDRNVLRKTLRDRRRAIPASERINAAERIASTLFSLPFFPKSGAVAGYWAMDAEIALHAWQLRLPETLTYCLPVLHADGRLRFAPWRSGAPLTANRYGIPEPEVTETALIEPEAMALVVVPLVGFDRSCARLGMGAGWYDRSFAFRNTRAAPPFLVGAAFAAQHIDTLTTESWDVPMDAVCTEHEIVLNHR